MHVHACEEEDFEDSDDEEGEEEVTQLEVREFFSEKQYVCAHECMYMLYVYTCRLSEEEEDFEDSDDDEGEEEVTQLEVRSNASVRINACT